MENLMRLKLKRKEFDESSDGVVFADFCLSSPAFKIRRLDADLPPITEEVAGIPLRHEQHIPESAISNGAVNQLNPLDIEELPFVPENNEKAIVLFNPMNNPLFFSPNNLTVDSNLISSLKKQALLHTQHNATKPIDEEEDDETDGLNNTCKAITPWVPSHQPPYQRPILSPGADVSDDSMMEIEDTGSSTALNTNHPRLGEGLQQCHPHCMIVEPPHNTFTTTTTTPIVWHR